MPLAPPQIGATNRASKGQGSLLQIWVTGRHEPPLNRQHEPALQNCSLEIIVNSGAGVTHSVASITSYIDDQMIHVHISLGTADRPLRTHNQLQIIYLYPASCVIPGVERHSPHSPMTLYLELLPSTCTEMSMAIV